MEYVIADSIKDMKPSAIREIFKSLGVPNMISLAAGNPSPLSFPVEKMGNIAKEIFEQNATEALQYGTTEGYMPLRNQVKERLKNKFNIGKPFDEVIITSGGQQAIDLAAKVLCNPGDTIICENPSFIGALNAFRTYNVNLVGIDIEDGGIDPAKLEKAIIDNPNTKLIYLIPTFQNPSGVCMTLAKRKAVLDIAKKYNVVILEDNPYGELRFAGEEIPTIKSLDDDGHVIYCSTFSKILSAGMRVGYCCAHTDLIQKIVICKQVNDVHSNQFFQILVSRFISEYDLDEHIQFVRGLYRRKCELMLKTMEQKFCGDIIYTRPEGGLFLWVTKPGLDSDEFAKLAVKNLVAVVPGSTFLPVQGKKSDSIRLNYSTPSDEQIVTGIERLAKLLNGDK